MSPRIDFKRRRRRRPGDVSLGLVVGVPAVLTYADGQPVIDELREWELSYRMSKSPPRVIFDEGDSAEVEPWA